MQPSRLSVIVILIALMSLAAGGVSAHPTGQMPPLHAADRAPLPRPADDAKPPVVVAAPGDLEVTCNADPRFFNTGYDGAGGKKAAGTRDDYWEAGIGTTAGPSSVTTWIAPYVGRFTTAWAASPFNNAEWISAYPSSAHTGSVDVYFRYRFDIAPTLDPATFAIGLDFYADNSVWEIYVNGQPQSAELAAIPQSPSNPYFYAGFQEANRAQTVLSEDWVTGANELIVQVRSAGPQMGFLAQVTSDGLCADYGDAPPSYATLRADGGAMHFIPGIDEAAGTAPLMLGSSIDVDADGQPTADATGDGADEDGVAFNPGLGLPPSVRVVQAGTANTARVTVEGSGVLSGWIDYDQNGAFDAAERIFDDQPVVDGVNDLTFGAADTVSHGSTLARFRLASAAGTADAPSGDAPDGEVEDYAVSVAAPVPNSCDATLVNNSFEQPAVNGPTPAIQSFSGGTIKTYHESVVPGWSFVADDPSAGTEIQRNAIEIWRTSSPAAYDGAQFAEVNAYVFGYLYQDIVTTPGTTLSWEFAHRGRAGNDTIALRIGPPGATTVQATETTGNTAWATYSGTYVVPSGQYITRFEFASVSTASGSGAAGNFLDAINFGLYCPEDFGDAPDSYGTSEATEGPRHLLDLELFIGAGVDPDDDGLAGAVADGDDTADTDDEDATDAPVVLVVGETTSLDVSATNDTAGPATLAWWLDADGSGTFDDAERSTLAIPAASGTATYGLLLPAGSTDVPETYLRLRLFSGSVASPAPTGAVIGGEVEDHLVRVAGVRYTKSVSPDDVVTLGPNATFTYTIIVENLGSVDLDGLAVSDDLSEVTDDATFDSSSLSADIGTAAYVEPVITWTGDLAAGARATITYQVTTDDPMGGDAILYNRITGTGPASNCPPPGPSADPACSTQLPAPRLEAGKVVVSPTADPGPGDTVVYRVTVANTGAVTAFGVVVADDLSGVLDDANLVDVTLESGSGSPVFDASTASLTWTGDIPAGESVVIVYRVRVDDAASVGDAVLLNALVAPTCPNPPILDAAHPAFDPECVTRTAVATPGTYNANKTVVGVERSGSEVAVTYRLTVTSDGGGDAAYDLHDQLRFGAGITVEQTSVTSVEPTGIVPRADWDGIDQHLVVDDQPIESGARHVYLVTVVASIASTISSDAADCNLEDGETGTAYLNTVWLDIGGTVASDRACQAVAGWGLPDTSLARPVSNAHAPAGWLLLFAATLFAVRRTRLQGT